MTCHGSTISSADFLRKLKPRPQKFTNVIDRLTPSLEYMMTMTTQQYNTMTSCCTGLFPGRSRHTTDAKSHFLSTWNHSSIGLSAVPAGTAVACKKGFSEHFFANNLHFICNLGLTNKQGYLEVAGSSKAFVTNSAGSSHS